MLNGLTFLHMGLARAGFFGFCLAGGHAKSKKSAPSDISKSKGATYSQMGRLVQIPLFVLFLYRSLHEVRQPPLPGPVGGGQTVSVNMLNWFGTKGKLIEVLRNFRVQISAYNPLCILVLKKAHLVYFANQETQELLARWCGGRHEMMIDVGVDITKFSDKDQKKKTGDITQILFAGSIEPRKGGALLLSAMSRLKQINNRFVCKIVGDGPDKSALEKSSELLGLEKNVIFMGRVSHDEMNRVFSEADVFTFPSLRDTSGAIVLEAMAMEIPTVCIDHQGAAIMVDKTSGLKIAPDSPDKMAEAIAVAISSLMEDDVICKKMGIAARERVTQEYDWSVRVQRTDEDYQELVC